MITKYKVGLFCSLISFLTLFSQGFAQGSKDYFQQWVDYKIYVRLDDNLHTLEGDWEMTYRNNSPDTLREIHMHLWPNAYSGPKTALAKQLLKQGDASLFNAKEIDRGYLQNFQPNTGGEDLIYSVDPENPDIGVIRLNAPLLPGESITLSSPFMVKIPASFSRLGHVGQSYQITQWYPKPAVYDSEGWHPMPYLDQGEFFSEFGSFEVFVSLPSNYVVAATGVEQKEENISFLNERIKAGQQVWQKAAFPPSSPELRTWHFVADSVHDFAFFADKRFIVKSDTISVPGRRDSLPIFIYYTWPNKNLWDNAREYVADGVQFYSEHLGPYPYPQVTAVDGTISAGGGMEYPMITVIGESPSRFIHEITIVHEVGHNWFYGILANDERSEPWMDEGLNSYYESRYAAEKYPTMDLTGNTLDSKIAAFLDIQDLRWSYMNQLMYRWQASENLDQAIDLHSTDFTYANYGAMVYSKSALVLTLLEESMGTTAFDEMMKEYYARYRFKHPQSSDFYALMNEYGVDTAVFAGQLLGSDADYDYAIKSVSPNTGGVGISMKNKGDIPAPFSMEIIDQNGNRDTIWQEGFTGKKVIQIDQPGIQKVKLDPSLSSLDLNHYNNRGAVPGVKKDKVPLKFQFLGSIQNPQRRHIYFAPVLGWNNYDKTMIGLAFYNSLIPKQKFEFSLLPMLSTGVIDFVGMGQLACNWYPKKLQRVRIELNAMRFNYNHFYYDQIGQTNFLAFNKISPKLEIEFSKKDPTSSFSHKIHYRSINIIQQYRGYDAVNDVEAVAQNYYHTNEVEYSLQNSRLRLPYDYKVTWQHCTDFAAISTTANLRLNYPDMSKGLDIRFFGGVFIKDESPRLDPVYGPEPPNRNFAASLSPSNVNTATRFPSDHTFDQIYLDRSGYGNFSRRQVALDQGGFRSIIPRVTDDWLITMTAASSFIWKIPLRPFVGVGVGRIIDPDDVQLFAEMGISVSMIPDILEVHFPFLTTNNIKENQESYGFNSFKERITFTLDITKLADLNIGDQFR